MTMLGLHLYWHDPLNEQKPASGRHCRAAIPKYRHASVIVPVVNDTFENVGVRAARDRLKEVALDDLAAVRAARVCQLPRRLGDSGGQVEDDAAKQRSAGEDGSDKGAVATADIDNLRELGKIVDCSHRTPDFTNLVKQAAEFGLAKPGTRVVPMQLMLDEVKAIGLPLGQGDYATMAFHHDRSPEARIWAQRFFERMKAMPTQIQAGTFSAVRHYLQAVRDGGTDEPLAVMAKMRATPVNDIFASGGYIREDGRMVHDMFLVQIKTPVESKEPWDLVKIIRIIPGDEAFRPLSESECPLLKKISR